MTLRQTVIINQNISTSASFNLNINNVCSFIPTKVIIRQLLYCNIAGNDTGIFLLWSSIASSFIGAVYVGIQANSHQPNSEININTFTNSFDFRLERANTSFVVPSGQLCLTLEFVRE